MNTNERHPALRKPHPGPADVREYLAAERTALAYIRTGLSMMGFGFVVARFGLVLRVMQMETPQLPHVSTGRSLWIGTGLVILGCVVNVLSSLHYWQLVRQLNERMNENVRASGLAVSLALVLTAIGLAMAAYLVTTSP